MRRLSPSEYHDRIRLFMDYARLYDVKEVPDPYYGGQEEFERVLDYCEDAAAGLLDRFDVAK